MTPFEQLFVTTTDEPCRCPVIVHRRPHSVLVKIEGLVPLESPSSRKSANLHFQVPSGRILERLKFTIDVLTKDGAFIHGS